MPRIPYKPDNLAEPKELVDAIRARRGGRLLELDRMLLHSPAFAAGWNVFLRSVRTELALSPKLRELAICAVAVLNRADYEFNHHAPEFLKAGGSPVQLEALQTLGTARAELSRFDNVERAVLQTTTEMTRQVQLSDATFSVLRSLLADDQRVVELIGVVATYNMVSRFLVALNVGQEPAPSSRAPVIA